MPNIFLEFEKGGRFEVELNEKDAPETCAQFVKMLPYEAGVLQARFSGTECFFRMPMGLRPEHIVKPEFADLAFNSNFEQAVCIYYDTNIHASDPPFNQFARLKGDLEELKRIGVRIWHEGMEHVRVFTE